MAQKILFITLFFGEQIQRHARVCPEQHLTFTFLANDMTCASWLNIKSLQILKDIRAQKWSYTPKKIHKSSNMFSGSMAAMLLVFFESSLVSARRAKNFAPPRLRLKMPSSSCNFYHKRLTLEALTRKPFSLASLASCDQTNMCPWLSSIRQSLSALLASCSKSTPVCDDNALGTIGNCWRLQVFDSASRLMNDLVASATNLSLSAFQTTCSGLY